VKLLILGGTQFVGRTLAENAIARGHEVTLFNRGQRNPELFGELERLRGDRDGNLDALRGRRWDVVIDTCGYIPRLVRDSCELLRDATEHYTFVSTCSVYGHNSEPGQDEAAPLATLDDPTVEEINGETYGGLKALCEEVVQTTFGERAFIPRPGLIVGPHDHTDRFTYWPVKVASFDRVLNPPPAAIVEFTDARDLAAFLLDSAERRLGGVFNVSGPGPEKISVADFLAACQDVADTPAEIVSPTVEFLLGHGVQPWTDLPLWTPLDSPGFSTQRIDRALGAGLSLRPVRETIRDTLDWARRELPDLPTLKAGLSRDREEELLAQWTRLARE
jgi:2'-hydroxyisoflavone reductase